MTLGKWAQLAQPTMGGILAQVREGVALKGSGGEEEGGWMEDEEEGGEFGFDVLTINF